MWLTTGLGVPSISSLFFISPFFLSLCVLLYCVCRLVCCAVALVHEVTRPGRAWICLLRALTGPVPGVRVFFYFSWRLRLLVLYLGFCGYCGCCLGCVWISLACVVCFSLGRLSDNATCEPQQTTRRHLEWQARQKGQRNKDKKTRQKSSHLPTHSPSTLMARASSPVAPWVGAQKSRP